MHPQPSSPRPANRQQWPPCAWCLPKRRLCWDLSHAIETHHPDGTAAETLYLCGVHWARLTALRASVERGIYSDWGRDINHATKALARPVARLNEQD